MTMPFRARPDRGSPPHERAQVLVAERLDGPLDASDAGWLEAHLAGCAACRSLADAYEADHLELQALRRHAVQPPRDLWARTSAALDREPPPGVPSRTAGRGRRASRAPIGAAAGLLVVAVVLGASLLSNPQGRNLASPSLPTNPLTAASVQPTSRLVGTPDPTALAVPPVDVPYLALDASGDTKYFTANVTEVCSKNGAQCAPVVASSPVTLDLPDAPQTVIRSPDDGQLVVLGQGTGEDGGTVVLVDVPVPGASPRPSDSPSASPSPSPTPTPTPEPSASVTPSPTAPPTATSSPTPSTGPTTSPSTGPTTSPSPAATPPGPTATVDATASAAASPTPTPTVSPTPGSPTPTATAAATPFAIAEDVIVDSGTAAFSPDGRYLAFSARPADGLHGPDIYLWTEGDSTATRMTDDHRSVFAGWLDDMVLGSRVVDESVPPATLPSSAAEPSDAVPSLSPTPVDVPLRPEAFVLDPTTGEVTVIPGRRLWRPSVDPSRTRAVFWDGTLELDDRGEWRTARGRLVVGPWTGPATGSGRPDPSESPQATPRATTPPSGNASVDVLAEGPIAGWDARWDETGTHLAVWIADPDDPSLGKLSLYILDPETGRIEPDTAPLRDERALPGFAIGDGRLVWATPPGQNAEESHLRILAWTDAGVGQVETVPADEIVVVR